MVLGGISTEGHSGNVEAQLGALQANILTAENDAMALEVLTGIGDWLDEAVARGTSPLVHGPSRQEH